jgi:K+-sensing histidine kinase KdpD
MSDDKDSLPELLARAAALAEGLLAENERLRLELDAHEARAREIERENHNLANLYVAAHQIHATLDLREVVATIGEILVNFIGAKVFAVYLRDDDTALRAVLAESVAREALRPETAGGTIGAVAATARPHYGATLTPTDPAVGPPLVAVPLRLRDQVVGVVAIWAFLLQKVELSDLDHELLNLLSAHAASALEAARLAAAAGPARLDYAALAGLI